MDKRYQELFRVLTNEGVQEEIKAVRREMEGKRDTKQSGPAGCANIRRGLAAPSTLCDGSVKCLKENEVNTEGVLCLSRFKVGGGRTGRRRLWVGGTTGEKEEQRAIL